MVTAERLAAALRAQRLPLITDSLYTDERGAAFLLDVNERTLRAWRARGDGPPAVLLRRWLYDLEELAVWLNSGGKRRQAAAEGGAPGVVPVVLRSTESADG